MQVQDEVVDVMLPLKIKRKDLTEYYHARARYWRSSNSVPFGWDGMMRLRRIVNMAWSEMEIERKKKKVWWMTGQLRITDERGVLVETEDLQKAMDSGYEGVSLPCQWGGDVTLFGMGLI
ncbi:hypothetical protein BJ508DRAFT_419828 [Ascobolus immersus RN42]|uniref:Uncharacterized protein n=1 Tax=Ascobolus immersus RN42 TaxID=1160509 RepID=A0A3N4HAZ9_ASCIM|nr:hypothetical protein BJ508DRAFT_419828 [Ascobolus immersus RN42]